ncbi:FAD-dependent oxidoreductase [Granulicoccus phenolivorans]|uniref:FAD-dependent oxidoreductase n=1 Tax=Granulicoccus phenolivorans TaxID=266854 RepID=UPI000402FFB7|nr:FAD-dependent oxidoreductase [Granulicoccus phenolivorans]
MSDSAPEVDVIVLGTGCAGLITALAAADAGASVAVYEKGAKLGGTTALSSGVAWLPANKYQADHRVSDSIADGRAYLTALSNGMILPEFTEAFLESVNPMLEWAEQRTPLRMRLVPGYPDYHPEFSGGKPGGGRSTEPELFCFDQLGEWKDRFLGFRRPMAVGETPVGGGTGFLTPEEEAERTSQNLEGLGRALLGALLKGLLDRGVEPQLERAAIRLITEQGRVVGVRFADGTQARARRGVVLATGGFERDPELVTAFLRGPVSHLTGAVTNTGDGLKMAMQVGAKLGVMREAWWVPVVAEPGDEDTQYALHGVQLVQRERTLPRTIMVNGDGRRFTNEAANYNALGGAFHEFHPTHFRYENQPCWTVFDQGFVDEYGGFGVPAGGEMPAWVTRADSLAELAGALGLPAEQLAATVQRWNDLSARGHDDDFGRGDSAFDGWCGDRRHYPGPLATLGPIDRGPFYAAPLYSSTLGTKGGPRTTVDCEVLDVEGSVIEGLWAVGNAMAAPTGMVYGGAGGTLGPAMVFGYRCGRAVAGAPA